MPRSVILLASVVATAFMGLVRFQARLFSWKRKVDRSGTPVAVDRRRPLGRVDHSGDVGVAGEPQVPGCRDRRRRPQARSIAARRAGGGRDRHARPGRSALRGPRGARRRPERRPGPAERGDGGSGTGAGPAQGAAARSRAADDDALCAGRPRPADRGPARPPAGRDGCRHDRRHDRRPSRPDHWRRRLDRGRDLRPGRGPRSVTARHARPRRDPPPRGRRPPARHHRDPSGAHRHPRPWPAEGRVRRPASGAGLPRRGPQARPAPRSGPSRGGPDERARYRQRRPRGQVRRRRAAGLHLHRQGGASVQRARPLEVDRRAARRPSRAPARGGVRCASATSSAVEGA